MSEAKPYNSKVYSRACIGLQKATQTVGKLPRLIRAPFMLSERQELLKQDTCPPVLLCSGSGSRMHGAVPRSLRRDRTTGCAGEPDSSPDSLRSVAEGETEKEQYSIRSAICLSDLSARTNLPSLWELGCVRFTLHFKHLR